MIRKGVIVTLTLVGAMVAVFWAISFKPLDRQKWPEGLDSFVYCLHPGTWVYVTSLSGWVRVGAVRSDPGMELRIANNRDVWRWFGLRTWPEPDMPRATGGPMGSAHLGGILVTCKIRFVGLTIDGIAVPHWAVCLVLLSYPSLAFVHGPLRRYRRRRNGLCVKCGYNLTGNVTGVCPECGTEIERS